MAHTSLTSDEVLASSRAARAQGDMKRAINLLHDAIRPLAEQGDSIGLARIADEADSIAADPKWSRSAGYVARRACSMPESAESAAPSNSDAVAELPPELQSEGRSLLASIDRTTSFYGRVVHVAFWLTAAVGIGLTYVAVKTALGVLGAVLLGLAYTFVLMIVLFPMALWGSWKTSRLMRRRSRLIADASAPREQDDI